MEKRRYTQRKRAESRDETRERIVAAAVELHEELGPSQTTISALAERAGVQRLTVYRHFPDEDSLIAACSSHWRERHPLPDPARWTSLPDAEEQARTALTALYVYYQANQRMLVSIHRDAPLVPAVRERLGHMRGLIRDIADGLALARSGQPTLRATLRHAAQFTSWQSLEQEGLDDGEKADLVMGWLAGLQVAEAPPR